MSHQAEPIAVIGSACRFPGNSNTPSKLWSLLSQPKDVLSKIPNDRFNPAGHYHPDGLHHGTTNVQESYFLRENIKAFDAQFFGMKAVEARTMDPQQRLLLESVYESLEHAGLPIEDLAGSKAGVFVGQMCEDWSIHLRRDPDKVPVYTATGTARSILSNRVSYFFNWHGPSMTIDTACSSSLVAVHLAVQSLRNGEAPIAVAAGANLIITPELYVAESKLKMLSPASRSRMWDADADGYARGEGVAALILKPLSAALRDGDHVECVIRETAINQDGRTLQGITMPSAEAQADLIRTAYAKAGLDLSNPSELPQYFEAHGTGTPAGDPQEAQAISEAFFGGKGHGSLQHPLYVGSVKTIIGHTEGTAGIAGLMKASLAIQNGIIPPNMHFNNLSPSLEPFYQNLEVPTKAIAWPKSDVRRASVNSFGFGGTNAHAIIESLDRQISNAPATESGSFRPFVFSAASQNTLTALLKEYSTFLKDHKDTPIRDLSYTLHSRRSVLPYKATITADTVETLVANIDAKLSSKEAKEGLGVRPSAKSQRILGIFTGQGAQWVAMGRELINRFASVRECLTKLDASLAALPETDRPSWSIVNQLLETDATLARLDEAALSQPLCTAVQIALVELLRSCGVSFSAVIGHSSGEIAAAYAAGFINSHDAIRIAYYRGVFAKLAGNGQKGAMLAVGTALKDAEELCNFSEFEGRIGVAACNSPSSITLSGDEDAIEEAKFVLEDEKKFARRLRVDTAYHSHHMKACSEAYTNALKACKIQISAGNKDTVWYSSVNDGDVMTAGEHLASKYWNDNMLQPVWFSQALSAAVSAENSIDIVLEVGPHPALQGPALQTIQDALGDPLPYTGLLKRGTDDTKSLVEGLSFLWIHGGKAAISLPSLDRLIDSETTEPAQLVSGLPSYPWDHTKQYWFDTRVARQSRLRDEPCHDLLGNRCNDTAEEYRWRNNLRIREIPWVTGHALQGQTVVPAAAYVATALEGARTLAAGRSIKLIEIEDMSIGRALTLDEGDESGVETLFTISKSLTDEDEGIVTAEFRYSSAANDETDIMALNASGKMRIVFGEAEAGTLPQRSQSAPNLVEIEEDLFYSNLAEVGYQYTGPFYALRSLKRTYGHGQGLVMNAPADEGSSDLLVHPAMLDAAIQSILLALCWPGDGTLRELQVPTGIRRIRVNPFFQRADPSRETFLPFDSVMSSRTGIEGDVDIFPEIGFNAFIQLEGLTVKPFAPATAANDRHVFSSWDWNVIFPDCDLAVGNNRANDYDKLVAEITERACVYYLKEVRATITPEEWEAGEWHHRKLLDFCNHVLNGVANGTQFGHKKEWLDTTREQLYDELIPQIGDCVEMRLVKTVGEHLIDAVRGKVNILEFMFEDNLLNDFYVEGRGVYEHTMFLATTVEQIVHRYGNMDILEIGAGTGGATKKIFSKIGSNFNSFTFTDVSTGFFEKAREVFAEQGNKMIFRALDCEKDIEAQNYKKGSYDLIVASLVLHATENLEVTLKNVRALLKPGGLLVMLELTPDGPMRLGFCMSGLPGWWLGWKDGRELSPCASKARWHDALVKSGFAGLDAATPDVDVFERPCYVLVSQAVDDRVEYLRKPLQQESSPYNPEQVVILGGKRLSSMRLSDKVSRLLKSVGVESTIIEDVTALNKVEIAPRSVVLSLTDLDEAMFEEIDEDKLDGLKKLLDSAKVMLWVTQGRRSQDPFANMGIGFSVTLNLEMPLLRTQFLDLEMGKNPDAELIVETLLSLQAVDNFEATSAQNPITWSVEPEIIQEDSRLMIPRLRHIKAANDRHNSKKRAITAEVSPQTSRVSLEYDGKTYALKEVSKLRKETTETGQVQIEVSHSSIAAVRTSAAAHYFVVVGKAVDSGVRLLGLAQENSSLVNVSNYLAMPCNVAPGEEGALIRSVVDDLLSSYILSLPGCGKSVLVHEPEPDFAAILEKRAAYYGVTVQFSTAKPKERPSSWTSIHPLATSRLVRSALPRNISCFVNCEEVHGKATVGDRIVACLPAFCERLALDDLLARACPHSAKTSEDGIGEMLRASAARASKDTKHAIISLTDVVAPGAAVQELAVVDWNVPSDISVKVQSLDSSTIFASDKTYVLFGLTSDLAQSLCRWMISHGARNVVLTSRNPKIEAQWMQEVELEGATVKVYANDITSDKAVQDLCHEIETTMPPVAGIANGAMVLVDTMITEMTVETWERVVKPKVNGSIYLERIFADKPLDFFIFFSSIAAVYGNEGQSNYGAANMYMTSLAYQRRQRGQPASVLHIGPITGAGYITREASDNVLSWVVNHGHCLLSQNDFFAGFAEAMLAGRPDLGLCPEVVLDERFNPGKETTGVNPKFQFTLPRIADEGKGSGLMTVSSARAGLAEATTAKEVYDIVKDGFLTKLHVLLQDESDDNNDSLLDRAANELGIDSLIAVDLRTWFLKELEVDMPVLKILGGASIREMLEFTIEKLPESLVPNLNGEARIVEEQEASAAPAATEEIVIHVEPAAESSVSSSPSTTSEEFVKVESTPSATTASSVISMSDSFVDTKPSNSKMSRVQDLSFGQSRFWTLMSLLEDSTALNIAALVKMSGPLRVNDLEKAVRLVGQRHEALRTCFYTDESGNAKQGILEQGTLSLEQKPLREEDVKKEFQAMRTYQFNLEQGEVMRVILSSQSSTLHHIIIAYHHIALDGVSLEIFLSDMQKTYNGQSLSSNVLQYPDFAARQQSEIRTGKAASELTYWKKQFPDFPAPLPLLPFSATRVRKTLNSYDFHSVDFRVDGALTSRIKLACKKHKATPFHFYFAAYQTLLFRLLNVDDVCIGMADANRLEHDAMTSIGNYLNLLPVRLQAKPVQSFVDAMQQVRTRTYGALGNSKIPFDVLLEELKVERSPLYGPLFQSFINYRQGVQEKRMFGDARAEGQEYLIAKTAYDMSLDIIDNPGGHATVSFMVQRSLYSEHDAERLMACYVRLLEAFSKKPTATLAQPSLYSQEQLDHALKRGRGPAIENKGPATLVHAVDQIAHNHAERPALKDSTGKHLTYRQMAARVNAIASALLSKDLGGEKRVAVFQEPTVDWACSMLAIMRTGSTYVPLDPRLSIERLKAIGKDCAPAGILINETTASDVPKLELGQSQVINVSKIAEQHQAPTKIAAQPNSPACILYTSGSTGLPKGIVLRHAGLANEIADSADKFSLTTNDKVLQQSALSFDMSLWQTFNALANGAMLYVMAQKDRVDPNIISSYIKSEGITGTWGTPSEYMMWLRDGDVNALQSSAWRVAVSGGEQVTQTHLDEFASLNKAGLSFWNGYGPTEVTIVSSTIELPYASGKAADSDRNPVGFTTRNCSVYVVDEHLQLLPVGYAGEILVGGPGVALGYLGNDALTKEKFLPDTFASSEQVSNGWMTMYRTGDRGRFRADGALIVEGRIEGDTEVKLRGLRIDLQDVEKAILRTANGTILNVVVTVRGEPQYLAAHLQFTHSFPVEQRGAFWTKTVSSLPLPKYMRPSIAVAVDNFPLTDHGKIDTQAVARMQLDETPLNGSGSGATLSENQATLRSLWVDILPSGQSVKDDINASTDFFQVGGNSGLLVRLQRGIRNAFDVVVPLMQLFEGSTLDSMVSLVEGFETQKTIDWDAEIAIDAAAIRSQTSSLVSSAPAKKAGEGKTVVLTGSTGNLGSAILSQLLADPSVSSIHCVAVRSNPTNADLFSQPQVTIHEGDLTAPLLGLSTSTFSTLATQADLIIHAGAARSFWDYYHTLRTTNVSSVREIVSLAAQRKVPIHFLSSGGVADLGNTTPSSDGKNGYVASKWAAEQLLQNASSQLDIPIVIHRTAGVEANASANQTVKEQVLRDFVAFAEKLRAVPDENLGWKGNMEVLPLSELSEAIAKSATTSSTEKVQFSNHSAVVKLSADEISAYAKQSLGDGEAGFEHLPAIEWVGKAKKAGWQWVFGKMDLVVEGVDGLNLHR